MDNKKQNLGQFNTKNDVWLRPHIYEFIKNCGCSRVVDPYAGAGDLLNAVNDLPWREVIGYDIDPSLGWPINDGLVDIPYHEDAIVITNPPYLAKNSAARNDLESYQHFKEPDNEIFEDLYQIALRRVLEKYKKAVFIIPETYFQTEFFKSHLDMYTVIEENPFNDTDCPVCVAAFTVSNDFYRISGNNYRIYKNDSYLFNRLDLEDIIFEFKSRRRVGLDFNNPNGKLGLRGVDGVDPLDRICFAPPDDLNYNLANIKPSSRAITLIDVEGVEINNTFLQTANVLLNILRLKTRDVILSPFKNNNKLGQRRRRLDYYWARKIIEKTVEALDK